MKKIDYDYIVENMEDIKRIIDSGFGIDGLCTFFRGQSDADWPLKPKVSREPKVPDPTIPKGENLFKSMAKKQHDRIPTRFLDFTTDPKVALYFACEKNADKDGKLFVVHYDKIDENSRYARILCELTQLKEKINLDEFANDISKKYGMDNQNIKCAVIALINSGCMISPTRKFYQDNFGYNDKIIKQSGCFFIPMSKNNYYDVCRGSTLLINGYSGVYLEPECIEIVSNDRMFDKEIIIKHELKKEIMKYLENEYDITSKSLQVTENDK